MHAGLTKIAGSDGELRAYVDNERTKVPIEGAAVTVTIYDRDNPATIYATDQDMTAVPLLVDDEESGPGWYGYVIPATMLPLAQAPHSYTAAVVSVKGGTTRRAYGSIYDVQDRT